MASDPRRRALGVLERLGGMVNSPLAVDRDEKHSLVSVGNRISGRQGASLAPEVLWIVQNFIFL